MNKTGIISVSVILFIVFAIIGNYNIQQMHSGGFYRTDEINKNLGPVLYYEEGLYATVTVRELVGNTKALFINGKGQGGQGITDLRVNFLLSYLPLLIKPDANNALVIGLGTGTTSGQLAQQIDVTTVEIESEILGASNYFNSFNLNVLKNPNHRLLIDDGRNYLLKSEKKYDLIIQEPSDPWQSFSAALYSKEFLELVNEDLNETGLYVYWIPVYTISPEDFRNFYKTFNEVFPFNVAFANIKPKENTPVRFETSEIILVGSKNTLKINPKNFAENYNNLSKNSKQQLDSIKLSSSDEIYNLLIFTNEQLQEYADAAQFVTDDKPILEFSTAKNVLNQNPKEVINDIERFIQNKG